tara:strand:+ start:245 stop:475 length:231 start_codon:yes stop_codon:yes gene_type:complete
MVSVSLDEVTMMMWEQLPIGERSKRVREAIRSASAIEERDVAIESMERALKHRQRIIEDMRLFCRCKGIKGGVDEE